MSTQVPGAPRVFPATSGRLAGWLGIAAVLAFLGTVWADDVSLGTWRITFGGAVVLVLVYAFMLRPKIVARGDDLVLVNPFEDIVIPVASISRLEVRMATMAWAGRKRYVGVAVGRKARQLAPGRAEIGSRLPGRVDDMIRATGGKVTGHDTGADLLEAWARENVDVYRTEELSGGPVSRRPVWWLIALAVVPLVALLVTFL